ncbi:glucans biosynthesis glucosyltransferase MdoH [Sphingomonas oleivorans]|uniref:Glucans biosynthesis glucosyltransferase H n=1 Tax=Sphingomonas oleivorans TaxID=1735121 RepID=A0A2T5FWM8_9SPHN|nr:glucans biosynthesis glucosyltransferase MdoH [Sphingomonas oleivorans]PTQ10189.1 glucans biosynthesis glucosyltransferase MdoH [Sphingomonas oleivorans]
MTAAVPFASNRRIPSRPDLPSEVPLAMPDQSFAASPPAVPVPRTSPQDIEGRRLVLIAATLLVTLIAFFSTAGVAAHEGLTLREMTLIALFLPLFGWIAFSFASALAGFLCLLSGQGHETLPVPEGGKPAQRTAVLMPIHNEEAGGVMARLREMMRSIEAIGCADRFDIFILSDSTEPLIRRAEYAGYRALREESAVPLYYRLRAANIGRKPGNIAEWIGRFGGAYENMIVLDADSLMGGRTMARLALAMERNPGVALLQTMPVVAGCRTLFARWQQFAARLYSPVSSAGLMWWSGSEASFWGHNAIIRVNAFAQCCALPSLPGREPLGGAILSHDLVEAAMLRRRGWAVHMVELEESFEEFPPSPIDHAIRDRRWCQGNLQHLRLLDAKGFHWVNRLQLLMGASAYLTSPLWLMLLIAGVIQQSGESGAWISAPELSWVFSFTLILLFGPKLMSVVWTLMDANRRARFGGAERILASVVIEIPFAVVMAPMVMMTQTMMLFDILRGRTAGWKAQRRDVAALSFSEAWRFYRTHVVMGVLLLLGTLVANHSLMWIAPVATGLIGAPFLAMLSARRDLGLELARNGLFVTPEELTALRIREPEQPLSPAALVQALWRRISGRPARGDRMA